MRRRVWVWAARLVVALGCVVMAVSAADASSVVLVGRVASKTGPQNARVWTITVFNDGSATANSAQIASFTLTQISGPACTPVVIPPASYPIALGNIAPAGSASGNFTIDFTGCAASNRFALDVPYSADAGTESGAIIRHNVFR
jgi:hypothetical protein